MTAEADIEARIEALRRLDFAGLRDAWMKRFRKPCELRSRDLVRRILAFEMQAEVYGSVDPEVKQKLRRVNLEARPKKARLQPGARLTREWRGSRYEVDVVSGGFIHEGTTYTSLSEVARAITGTRWSGPRFFGLSEGAGA